ncbi:MAG: lactoylglutathione lyase [Bradyrhizobiaceae bacterium]|nr:MAG: lactoylglutathione lyase [Bradyrhizobiaceae bacterium]
MRYLHAMVRVANLDESLDFYCTKFGMKEVDRKINEEGKYTLVFLAAPNDTPTNVEDVGKEAAPLLELTYNWGDQTYSGGRNFGHLAFEVENIYETCRKLSEQGVVINRPPRDGTMAFIRSPDDISIELLQKGKSLPREEPWASMSNTGSW